MKRVGIAVLTGVAVLATPQPAYAHTIGGEGGLEIEALLLGLVAIGAAVVMRPRVNPPAAQATGAETDEAAEAETEEAAGAETEKATPAPEGGSRALSLTMLLLGIALLVASVVIPRMGEGGADTDARVEIVSPQPSDEVTADKPIEVVAEVTNGSVATSASDTSGGHLHLYVDGKLQQMPYSETIELTLERGAHDVTVEYVDLQHVSFDPPVQDTIEVTAR